MPRTISYASAAAVAARPRPRGIAPVGEAGHEVDGYLDRLAKYVPAEVLAGFAPLAVATKDRPELLTAVGVIFTVLTPIYFYITKVAQPVGEQPKVRGYLYILSPISFVIWAVKTSESFRDLVGAWQPIASIGKLDEVSTTVALVVGALVIPAIDIIVDYWLARRERVSAVPGPPAGPIGG